MELATAATGAQALCSLENPALVGKTELRSRRRSRGKLSFSFSASSPPCGSSASSRSRPDLSTRVSELTSPQAVLKDWEAETPWLLEQCSDLDWKTQVGDLRSQALHELQSGSPRALSLRALDEFMGSSFQELVVDGIESLTAEGISAEDRGWSLEAATSALRMEANLQAAQVLAKGVDSSFDWETAVAELHQRNLLQGGVQKPEQRLLQSWASAQSQMVETSNKLVEDALASSLGHGHAEPLESISQAEVMGSNSELSYTRSKAEKSLLSLGMAVATGLAVEGSWLVDAVAEEGGSVAGGTPIADAVAAVSKAPSWLIPAVLLFPPLSYFLFNVYRDQVNPQAKVTDWMFGVLALTIVSNLVMMAVWGVRLY